MNGYEKLINRIMTFCLGLGIFVLLFSIDVQAADTVSVTLYHKAGGKAVEGVLFSAYQVGELTSDGELKLNEEFQKYSFSLDIEDTSSWKNLSEALAAVCIRDNILPKEQKATDANGVVVLGEEVSYPAGVYLILGDDHRVEDTLYTVQPIMLHIQENIGVETKCEAVGQTDMLTVFKVWENDKKQNRPAEVTIQLIDCTNRAVYQEIVLNDSNQWKYTWAELPADRTWAVIEKTVPSKYVMAVRQEENQAEVRNIRIWTEEELKPDKIIQTGSLWWPVPVFTVAGMMCILLGLLWRQKNE